MKRLQRNLTSWLKVLSLSLTFGSFPKHLNAHTTPKIENTSETISSGLWTAINSQLMLTDWAFQRQTAWQIQEWLFTPQAKTPQLPLWQEWFDRDDLKHIFFDLYGNLSSKARRERQVFPPATIESAIERFVSHRSPQSESLLRAQILAQNPRLTHILINRQALRTLLLHYAELDQCYRLPDTETCPSWVFPEGSAWLKSAWRRFGQDFTIPGFSTDASDFLRQQSSPSWMSDHTLDPQKLDVFTLSQSSEVKFALVGLHLMLKRSHDWLWTSLWLDQSKHQGFAADAPSSRFLSQYRLCSVLGFQSPLQVSSVPEQHPLKALADTLHQLDNPQWCSNPYLELGPNNQKTQCVGCHQFAGQNQTQADLAQLLQKDPDALIRESSDQGPTDFVWSLVKGPQPFALSITEGIEYFDAYDPYP